MLVTVSSPSPAAMAQATRAKVAADYVRYIESHGFGAWDISTLDSLCVVVAMPFTQSHADGSKTEGIEPIPCRSFSEVRFALGY